MPVRWETVTLDVSARPNDDAVWVTQSGRRWGTARRGALMALCDLCDGRGASTPNASNDPRATALSVLEDFFYHPPRVDDPEPTLTGAIAQALFIVRYFPADGQMATAAGPGTGVANGARTPPGDELSLIAATVCRATLYVAQSGQHRAWIWREGALVALDIDPPSALAMGHAHYRLARKDRVLLCSERFYQSVSASRIADILRAQPGPDRAITALLGAAADTRPAAPVSVAVLDYDPFLAGVALPRAVVAGMSAVAVLGVLALSLGGRLSFAGAAYAPAPLYASPTVAVSETSPPTRVHTPSDAPAAAVVPTSGIGVALATATVGPPPASTATPALELTPSGMATRMQTPAPVSISAANLNPTATSIPADPLAHRVPLAETATRPPGAPTVVPPTAPAPPTGLPDATPTPPTEAPVAASIRALNPRRVIPSRDSVPITLTAHISLTAPAAYLLSVRQGQTLSVWVTSTVYLQVLNAQGQALTFPGQAVQLPILQTGDYIVLVKGDGAVTVNITVSPP